MTDRSCPVSNDVATAAQILRDGGLVAFATETVYGLGGNALDPVAVAGIFEAKGRPHFDPLIVHVADDVWLDRIVLEMNPTARRLAEAFWPGPLTLVVPRRECVPDLVTSGLPNVAVRMPAHPQARELLLTVDLPIAAPSANPFGQLSPTTAEHVHQVLGDRIDLVLDGGPCSVGVESTVVLATTDQPVILRHGGLTREEIEEVVGPVTCQLSTDRPGDHSNFTAAPAPGMLSQHYSPRTPLILADEIDSSDMNQWQSEWKGRALAVLRLTSGGPVLHSRDDLWLQGCSILADKALTDDGNLRTAAAGFFAALRQLDQSGADLIIAASFPDVGLGRALNDRLRRAACRLSSIDLH